MQQILLATLCYHGKVTPLTRNIQVAMTVPTTPSEWRKACLQGTPPVLPNTDEEWKRVLEPMTYAVLRDEATEPKWSSELNKIQDEGVFLCAGCAQPLFVSKTKFESGSGWPSFYAPASADAVKLSVDFKAIVPREETLCGNCGGHLGHTFSDGPAPTGKRYCMNGGTNTRPRGSNPRLAAQPSTSARPLTMCVCRGQLR